VRIVGFFIFKEIPALATLMGALIIVPSTAFTAYMENKQQTE